MLTVTVGFDASGKRRTFNPLARRYSVMPSTVVTRVTPAGRPGVGLVTGMTEATGVPGAAIAGMARQEARRRQARARGEVMGDWGMNGFEWLRIMREIGEIRRH